MQLLKLIVTSKLSTDLILVPLLTSLSIALLEFSGQWESEEKWCERSQEVPELGQREGKRKSQ